MSLEIVHIIKGSITDNIGLRSGDKILIFNDIEINSLCDYIRAKKTFPDRESIVIDRKGKRLYYEWDKVVVSKQSWENK